jgi:hypothetical protein
MNVSVSSSKSGFSRSRQESKERIFDVSNLAELSTAAAPSFRHHALVWRE